MPQNNLNENKKEKEKRKKEGKDIKMPWTSKKGTHITS